MAASVGYVLAQLQRWTSSRLDELSDAVLLERFRHERDESAFAALVARHGDMVLRSCRRILGDVHEAEDAFQATFLILARKAHLLRQPRALPGFLHSIARRVALKARTKAASCPDKSHRIEKLPDPHPDPLTQVTAREVLTILDEEVARLPAAQRSAVLLCCLEGHTREEAARILGCSPGSLKGHLERGRRRLQTRLQRRGIALAAALALATVSRSEAASVLIIQSTVKAALGSSISSPATALAHSVLQAMFWPKLAGVMAVTLTLVLAASATVILIQRDARTEDPEDKTPVVSAASKDAGASKPQGRTDALGDPLPQGAIARLGTVRFRHGGYALFLAFTPDEKRLISRGIDGVRLWDAATGKELWHLPLAPNTEWRTVDLSPDGKRLALIDQAAGGPIQLWDVESGKKIASLGSKLRPPIRFSPDGKWLAAAVGTMDVELWDLASKKRLRGWNAHMAELLSIGFSADCRIMLTSDRMSTVHLWDTASGRKLQEIKPLLWDPAVGRNAFSDVPVLTADGKFVAILEKRLRPDAKPVVDPKASISVWDAATGKLLRELTCPSRELAPGYGASFMALALAPDGKKLVTTGPDQFLRIWDPATGQELRRVALDSNRPPYVLAFSKDGQKLAASSDSSTIQIFDMTSGKLKLSPVEDLGLIQRALLTSDGRTAITTGPENSILVWDAEVSRVRQRLQGHEKWLGSLQLSADGQTLYSAGGDKTLRIWDLVSGEEHKRINVDAATLWTQPNPLVLSDGKTLIAADSDKTVRVLDMATGQERRRFQLERLFGMAASADGRSLVGYSCNGLIRLWDVASGRTRRDYRLPVINEGLQAYSMALSPDGRLLAVGRAHQIGLDTPKQNFLLLLDLNSGHEVYRFENLPTGVDLLEFSPDGRILAWGGFTYPVIRLLETATGRERRRLTGHRGAVTSLSFSADGRRLLSGSHDTTALLWDLDGGRTDRLATTAEIEKLWADLAGEDAACAYAAIRTLAAVPNVAIPFLRKHLPPVPAVDEKRVARLIADLDSDDFATRQRATADLEKLGEQALPAYRKALDGKPSLEMRRRLEDLQRRAYAARWDVSGERLRSLRAIETLEMAGSEEARDVLKALAAGAKGARLTEEAKATLKRLQR